MLSNNDGCAVSRTDEAKDLGIQMGAVYFQIKDLIQKHNVQVFSSNYTLYGDMSHRVMQTLSAFTPELEIYSIDEAFLSLTGMSHKNLINTSHEIKNTVYQYTGIPTCIGLGPTKVLAKMANRIAKKNKTTTQGVFSLLDESIINEQLQKFPVEDIWGIGRQSAKKLHSLKIKTAYDLKLSDPEWIRKILTVVGARIVEELRGQSCLELVTDIEDRKQIISSRSFGRQVTDITELKESIANHVTNATEKLRSQNLICKNITVFVQTNPFKNTPQYYNSGNLSLMSGTAITPKLIKAAFQILDQIYIKKYEYKKVGIILNDLIPKSYLQTDFFGNYDSPKEDQLMYTMDKINLFHGKGTLKSAACGTQHFWKMLSEMKSPCYTTRWSEIRKIDF